jgi:hypothetical protein
MKSMDRDNPFNAEVSAHLAAKAGSNSAAGPGIRQRNIALKQGEKYTFSLYARGSDSVVVTFYDGNTPAFSKTFTDLTAEWQKFTVEFTASSTVDAASPVDQLSAVGRSAIRSPSSPPRPWPRAAIGRTCSRPSPTFSLPPSAGPAGLLPVATSGRT